MINAIGYLSIIAIMVLAYLLVSEGFNGRVEYVQILITVFLVFVQFLIGKGLLFSAKKIYSVSVKKWAVVVPGWALCSAVVGMGSFPKFSLIGSFYSALFMLVGMDFTSGIDRVLDKDKVFQEFPEGPLVFALMALLSLGLPIFVFLWR